MSYRYNCREFPGMGECPGSFTAATQDEVMKHAEVHGVEAHSEDPADWSDEDRQMVRDLSRPIAE